LEAVDPATAARLHPNDVGRIIRALELFAVTGHTMSEQNIISRQNASPYEPKMIVLDVRDRSFLYDRINKRVDMMLEAGLLEEATAILHSPYAPTAMQAIGYKELHPFVNGEISLDQAIENLKQSTRKYAKRQLSWFRRIPDATHLYIDDYADGQQLLNAAKAAIFD
jgi:tRNA dimethylallyltransferase